MKNIPYLVHFYYNSGGLGQRGETGGHLALEERRLQQTYCNAQTTTATEA